MGIRGFAVVHSSGTWHNHLVFSIVVVNPSPEEVEVEKHPLVRKKDIITHGSKNIMENLEWSQVAL